MRLSQTANKLNTILLIGLIILIGFFSTSYKVQGECNVSVSDDAHVAPAAELATTKGYPDIITLENSQVKVTSIPNRGRLLFDYQLKSTGNSLLRTNKNPLPLETEEGFFLEFGGFYSSYPWNDRANQPFDMKYEIVQNDKTECSVKIYRDDPDLSFDFEALISLEASSSNVDIELKFKNKDKSSSDLSFFNKFVANPGNEVNEEMWVELPQGVERIQIVESTDDWMGQPGQEKSWPQSWQKWGNYQGEGTYALSLKDLEDRFIKVRDPESQEFVGIRWNEAGKFTEARVLSWGPSHDDTMGAYPGFAVSIHSKTISLKSDASETFNLKLVAGRG